jgi:uncharacterized membrane protein HdeD (DUF308 family)
MSSEPIPLSALAPKAINWSIALSFLLILAGLCAILIPFLSSIGITIIFAWAMIFSSITHFIFAFKTHTTGSRIWEILVGVVYLITGVVLLMHPVDGLLVLTLVLAYYLFFEGVVEIFHYFQIRPRHGAVWLLIDGIVTLILALMIWRSWPQSSIWVVGTLVGISMILSGVSRLMLSLAAKRVINRIV